VGELELETETEILVDLSSSNNAGNPALLYEGARGRGGRGQRGKRGVDSVERSVESEGNGMCHVAGSRAV
jgi:hypothetical protein